MAANGKEYAQLAYEVYSMKPQAGYIYGTSGVMWTQAKQAALEKKYYSDPAKYSDYELSAKYGSKWFGHVVYDCSGLTSKLASKLGLKYYHGSNSSWNKDCAYKGKIVKGMKLPAGAWTYTGTDSKKPHIGIVDPTGEWVIEAQGTKAGVVRTKLSNSKWKYWGLGKGMEYDFIPGETTAPVSSSKPEMTKPVKTVKKQTLRRGSRGNDVKELQTILSKAGSSLAIDGIFGPGTQSAVRAFQKKHNLVVDGIVGPKTWAELLKVK